MRNIFASLAALLLIALGGESLAQVPNYNLPANTVVGRLGVGTGPAEFVPLTQLRNSLYTTNQNTVFAGPSVGGSGAATFRSLTTGDFPSIITGGSVGSGTQVPVITYDATGRITAATSSTISLPSVSPSQYGAVCNGTTDDTTALNNMYAGVAAGSIIQFPPSQCKITGTVTIGIPSATRIPANGGVNNTSAVAAFKVTAGYTTIACDRGGTINGPRTPNTGNDFVFGSWGVYVPGTSGSHIGSVKVSGCTITNMKDGGIRFEFCDDCTASENNIQSVSYSGIMCYVCMRGRAQDNFVFNVSSSNGPANASLPANTKTNAYGITFTTDGAGNFSQNGIVANNIVLNVPTWECYDTHAGIQIRFVNNIGIGCRVGIQITTDGGTNAPTGAEVLGNYISCYALNQPIYPGGPSTSVGGAGIYVGGVQSGNQAADINIVDNTVVQCGSSESATGTYASIEVGDAINFRVDRNNITAGRFRGILLFDQAIGQVSGNNFNGLVAGPLASGNILIEVATATCECLLARNFGNSSGSEGYKIAAQNSGWQVGISRDNSFFNLASLYDAGGPATNRVDLGATAP